jgi:hypothetical protein
LVDRIDLESLGTFSPRGKLEPIEIFGLQGFEPSLPDRIVPLQEQQHV